MEFACSLPLRSAMLFTEILSGRTGIFKAGFPLQASVMLSASAFSAISRSLSFSPGSYIAFWKLISS